MSAVVGRLGTNARMEDLSLAFIRAVAAQAGFTCEQPKRDVGVDLEIADVQHMANGKEIAAGRSCEFRRKAPVHLYCMLIRWHTKWTSMPTIRSCSRIGLYR
jgi:hypothetical protein